MQINARFTNNWHYSVKKWNTLVKSTLVNTNIVMLLRFWSKREAIPSITAGGTFLAVSFWKLSDKSDVWDNNNILFFSLLAWFWTLMFLCTVVRNWESTKPHLCDKLPLFKTPWWILRVLPQLCPLESFLQYLRAFQWGTVWPCNLRGFKNTTGQS